MEVCALVCVCACVSTCFGLYVLCWGLCSYMSMLVYMWGVCVLGGVYLLGRTSIVGVFVCVLHLWECGHVSVNIYDYMFYTLCVSV